MDFDSEVPDTRFTTPIQMQQVPVHIPPPDVVVETVATETPSKKKRTKRISLFKRRPCNNDCFMLKRAELMDRYGLSKNKLAQRFVSQRHRFAHKCTPRITDARDYKRFKAYCTTVSWIPFIGKDAAAIIKALDKYEKDLEK